ncbi:MAG: polysaccharide biosynthesis/export family protein [Pseudomonadota bacterium]
MRSSHRAFFWVAILGIAITLVVVLLRPDDPPSAQADGSTRQSIDNTRTAQRVAAGAESAASIMVSGEAGDESAAKCTQILNQAEEFATRERDAATAIAGPIWSEEHWHAEVANMQRGLASSRDPEDFLAAVLLDQPERRADKDASAQTKLLDLGERAISSGSKLLAWNALRACDDAKQFCPIAHLEQRLLEVDRQNAEAWALVATLKYKRGDVAGALIAMQGAARAPNSTWYWTEMIALIERTLAAQTDMPYSQRMASSFGVGMPSQSNLLQMCKVESAASRVWGEVCLAFGKLRAEHNETEMAQTIAYSLREQVLTALGQRERAAEVAAEHAQMSAARSAMAQEPASSMTRLQMVLMETDPQQLHTFLGAIQQYGEVDGRRMYLRQEVPPLLARAGLLEREGAQECAAHFFAGTRPATAGQQAQVADEMYITVRSTSTGWSRAFRVRPDGKITLPSVPGAKVAVGSAKQPEREIKVTGKTTEQIQREIATLLAADYRSPEVLVVLLARRSDAELQLEFDNARREAAERRSKPR